MDYGQRLLADRLAAAYAAGVLRGAARRRYEALLPAHPLLREALRAWNERLMPLSVSIEPVPPPPRVWQRILERINGHAAAPQAASAATGTAPAPAPARGLAFWRGIAAFASVAALALALVVALPSAVPAPVVVVLASTGAPMPGERPAAIVASFMPDANELVAMPITPVDMQPDRSLHLWAIPAGGAPRSLGLMSGAGGTVALPARALEGASQLAVSLEPRGGSPGPGPTGPVVYAGTIRR